MIVTMGLQLRDFAIADRFVSIGEIKKSPKQTLSGIKIIMNGNKPKGIYMDINEREEYLEDMEMINSASYIQAIRSARASGNPIPAEQVW